MGRNDFTYQAFFLFSSLSFSLLASFSFCDNAHSTWPFTLRNSSAAHFSRALYISLSIRMIKLFLGLLTGFSLAERIY